LAQANVESQASSSNGLTDAQNQSPRRRGQLNSSEGAEDFAKRISNSTDTFLKRSISTKSSSQERLIPFIIQRNEEDYNEDDLRLLKERLKAKQRSQEKMIQSKPVGVNKAPAASHGRPPLLHEKEGLVNLEVGKRSNPLVEEVRVAGVPPAKLSTPFKNGNGTCLRMSGCKCPACTTGIIGASDTGEGGGVQLVACETCGRKFAPKSLAVHQRVCDKVFGRRESEEEIPGKLNQKQAVGSKKGLPNTPVVSQGMAKWRKQSQELRVAMQRGRGINETSNLNTSGMLNESNIGGAEDDGFVSCPHCERRFNEKAAERHIPKCNDIRSKPKMLKRGEGRSVHSALLHSPAVSTNSPSKTPGSGAGRKSLSGAQPSIAERVVNVPCPFCKRQFSTKNLERHVETCAGQRYQRSSLGGRSSSASGTLVRRQVISPSVRSESSWDGDQYE